MPNFEIKYYGLLHLLKEMAPILKHMRDFAPDPRELDRYVSFIDHEVLKNETPEVIKDEKSA